MDKSNVAPPAPSVHETVRALHTPGAHKITRLRVLRYERNLKAKEVSEKTGLSCGVIYALERGTYSPCLLSRLAEFYGVSDPLSLRELVNVTYQTED